MTATLQYLEANCSLICCSVDSHNLERHDERRNLQRLTFLLTSSSLGDPSTTIRLMYPSPSLYKLESRCQLHGDPKELLVRAGQTRRRVWPSLRVVIEHGHRKTYAWKLYPAVVFHLPILRRKRESLSVGNSVLRPCGLILCILCNDTVFLINSMHASVTALFLYLFAIRFHCHGTPGPKMLQPRRQLKQQHFM